MRQCAPDARFRQIEIECILQVCTLVQHEHVKVPRTTEIRHDNCMHRLRMDDIVPRCSGKGRHCRLWRFTERFLDVFHFFDGDCRMFPWFFEDEPQPECIPRQTDYRIEVERCLPTDVFGQDARQWHADDNTGIRSTECHCCESRTFEWRCPESPDAMTCWICHSLQNERERFPQFAWIEPIAIQLTSTNPWRARMIHRTVTLFNDMAPGTERFRKAETAIAVPNIRFAGKNDARKPAGICVIK